MVNTNEVITLQVGERRFTTGKETLADESQYFKTLFSGNWKPDVQPDGSYFLDADGDIFAHVLRYLRSKVFPLLFDRSKGFDFAIYTGIRQLANFLIIPRLEAWIANKRYEQAVKIFRQAVEVDACDMVDRFTPADFIVSHYPNWSTRKVYICPREITVHRGKPQKCGRDCDKARGGRPDTYEDEAFADKVLEVEESVCFMEKVCMEYEDETIK